MLASRPYHHKRSLTAWFEIKLSFNSMKRSTRKSNNRWKGMRHKDIRNARYRFFVEDLLDFLHNTVKDSPARELYQNHFEPKKHFRLLGTMITSFWPHIVVWKILYHDSVLFCYFDLILLVFFSRLPGPLLVSFPQAFALHIWREKLRDKMQGESPNSD